MREKERGVERKGQAERWPNKDLRGAILFEQQGQLSISFYSTTKNIGQERHYFNKAEEQRVGMTASTNKAS